MDHNLQFQITELLDQNDQINSKEISVEVSGDRVTLRGKVDGPDSKDMLCEMIQKIRGVGRVVNELQVKRENASKGSYRLSRKAASEARDTGNS